LATQTSGLPFFPPDVPLGDQAKAIEAVATYTPERIYQFLSSWKPPREAGTKWEYSNLGFGLLGLALASRADESYESLIRARISAPLGLSSTMITLTPQLNERLATGHTASLQVAPAVNMPAYLAAGCLRSSANDLLTFLAAFLGYTKTPLAPAMKAMLETRRPGPSFQQALGWWVVSLSDGDAGFVFHGGETPGFWSSVAYDPHESVGVVVLSNGAADDGGLSWHLLRPSFPVATSASEKARRERVEIVIDRNLAGLYTGQYKIKSGPAAGLVITIEQDGRDLVFKNSSTPPEGLRLHAETEQMFLTNGIDLGVSFERNAEGRLASLTVYFGERRV